MKEGAPGFKNQYAEKIRLWYISNLATPILIALPFPDNSSVTTCKYLQFPDMRTISRSAGSTSERETFDPAVVYIIIVKRN